MSELMTVAGQIVPFVSAGAASMGLAVLTSAQTRVAEGAVERGRLYLRELLRRHPAEGERDRDPGGEPAAVVAIRGLSPRDGETLAAAIGDWLSGNDLSESALHDRLTRAVAARRGSDTFHVEASGPGSVAIGRHEGDIHAGYRPRSGNEG